MLAAMETSGPIGLAAVLVSYLLGSVPCGLLLGRLRGVDVRSVGSGNIGATNVGRALGRPWALVAFVGDFLKGFLPSAVIAPFAVELAGSGDRWLLVVLCGGAAVCGHVWPIYLRFRGGKGVATGCGALVGIDPVIFLGGGLVWLATMAVTRFVGLASILMSVAFPLVAWWRTGTRPYGLEVVLGAGAFCLLVLIRHRANMARMLAGTEPRAGASRPGSGPEEQGR
jgi:glycerol-3-phosphate acyltransferase PlsY